MIPTNIKSKPAFHHVSTDEVFARSRQAMRRGEESSYAPNSPYAASKAASDHLVRSYGHTYGLPYTLTNCSNNYGPHQFPEKLIPLVILNALEGKPCRSMVTASRCGTGCMSKTIVKRSGWF